MCSEVNLLTSASKLNNCDTCESIRRRTQTKEEVAQLAQLPQDEQSEPPLEGLGAVEDKYGEEGFEEEDDDDEYFTKSTISSSLSTISRTSYNNRRAENRTFPAEVVRDIERRNMLLMQRILSNERRSNQYNVAPKTFALRKVPSAAINRRRDQEKIAHDNRILLKKIQSVKSSIGGRN